MPPRHPLPLALLAAASLTVAAAPAPAATYPTNACVAAKQKAAGRYCQHALEAWARWETKQDAAARDAALARARARLGQRWDQAEVHAAGRAVDCADTTLAADDASEQVDSAVGAIVAAVNDGLALGDDDQARCGRRVLDAAGTKCAGLLRAESALVEALQKDPTREKRARKVAEIEARFSKAWARATADACPTTATEAAVEGLVDELAASLVRDTIVSPNVDQTGYTTISPTGTTEYLGKSLTPVCMEGSPYHFFAKRGTVNKLVVYYQGGGACWEQLTCSVPVCDPNVDLEDDDPGRGSPGGFADLDNPDNPFRDWHAVFVSYCSCDIHFGDAAQDYANVNPADPVHVEHRGFHNARVVEKWAREHFVNPDVVFVTGSSAGAYGAWFHGPLLQEVWPASRLHVLADAGNGVITEEFLDTYFPNWAFAENLPDDVPGLQEVLESGGGIPAYTTLVAHEFPNVTWAHYTTAYDGGFGGQTGFYNVMLNDNDPIAALSWWEGSCAFNAQMRTQALGTAAENPANYRYYIGTGSRHTMWGSNKVYTDVTGGVPPLVDWVKAMLASGNGAADPAWQNVECTDCGLLLPNDPRPNPLAPPFTPVGGDVAIQCGGGSPSGAFLE